MKRFITNPDVILALILIVGCLILVGLGIDSEIKGILGASAGYVFGRGITSREK